MGKVSVACAVAAKVSVCMRSSEGVENHSRKT
jgi:hypothetical protein